LKNALAIVDLRSDRGLGSDTVIGQTGTLILVTLVEHRKTRFTVAIKGVNKN